MIELLAPQAAKRGIELKSRLDESLPTCPADPEGIHRALLNVVGNALDAVGEVARPKVLVGTLREPADGSALICCSQPAGDLVLDL